MSKFQIERDMKYKANGEKYQVHHNGKIYTVYFKPFDCCYPLVCTGDGTAEDFENITHTKLGTEMVLACYSVKNEK